MFYQGRRQMTLCSFISISDNQSISLRTGCGSTCLARCILIFSLCSFVIYIKFGSSAKFSGLPFVYGPLFFK